MRSRKIGGTQVAPAIVAGMWMTLASVVPIAAGGELCEPHWDNTIGQPGMDGMVSALTEYNGDLIAAGQFISAGGQTVNRVARWDGSSWHPLETGGETGMNNSVRTLTTYDGQLVVGGTFTTGR